MLITRIPRRRAYRLEKETRLTYKDAEANEHEEEAFCKHEVTGLSMILTLTLTSLFLQASLRERKNGY